MNESRGFRKASSEMAKTPGWFERESMKKTLSSGEREARERVPVMSAANPFFVGGRCSFGGRSRLNSFKSSVISILFFSES